MVTHAPLRVVFFGTPEFAVPTLAGLLASRHRVVGVVTQPDRPRGRGQQVSASPVKSLALERGVPVLQPEKMRDEAFVAALRALDADLGVVAAYGRILTDAILAIPRLGMVNVHASLLPRWRGAAPIHRAILAGDTETGVTIMRVVHELDAGPMMATLREPIGPTQTTGEVERDPGHARRTAARRGGGTHGRGPGARGPAAVNRRHVRGSHHEGGCPDLLVAAGWRDPQPGARAEPVAAGLHVARRRATPGAWPPTPASRQPRPARCRARCSPRSGDRFVVAAGHGTVQLLTVKPEGRRAMAAREFLAGHQVSPGAVLG